MFHLSSQAAANDSNIACIIPLRRYSKHTALLYDSKTSLNVTSERPALTEMPSIDRRLFAIISVSVFTPLMKFT